MKANSFSINARLKSFRYAIKGIIQFFLQEPNAWIHLLATTGVVIGIFYFKISNNELLALILSIGFVWVAELFNTAIERIMDFLSPGYDSRTAIIKDLSAGAVLLSALTAATIGLIVFIPKIFY